MTIDRRAPLSSLRQGQSGQLVEIGGERPFRRRLLEMGLVPGTEVRVIKIAPLGDPLELEVRGTRLSMRRAEAARLMVVMGLEAPVPSLRRALSLTDISTAI